MKERRRAVEAKLVEKSKSNPGYYKYQVKIRELDGREHTVPSYGVDMTDAIRRIVKNENKEKIDKIYNKRIAPITLSFMVFLWMGAVLLSAILNDYRYAYIAVITLFSVTTFHAIYSFIKDHVETDSDKSNNSK
tara:strand:+ start:259 stop:660 length:402 start_codon:yes stop_codon:yes gene_type:complete